MTEPEDEGEFMDWLRSLPPEEQERLRSHHSLVMPARSFVAKVWEENDLRGAWPLTDPLLRECLAQKWLCDNENDVARDGWDKDEIVAAFVADAPDHPLWGDFERVHLRGFGQWDDLSQWGTGVATRLHSPDVEAIVFLPPGVTVWEPDEEQWVYTFLMRHNPDAGWRILNIGGDFFPEPGWPPRLSAGDADDVDEP